MSTNGKKYKPNPEVLRQLPIRAWEYPRILLSIPMFAALPYAADVFYDFMAIAARGPAILRGGYQRTDAARETACEQFMDTDFSHILMLDADHKHPPDIIQRLAKWVIDDPGKLVVAGLNFRRTEPYEPLAYIIDDNEYHTLWNWDSGLLEVDRIATCAILIAREVFEQIRKPWFYMHSDNLGKAKWSSDDMAFCLHCKEAGIQIWCDTTTTSPHMTQAFITEDTYIKYVEDNLDKYPVKE